MAAKLEKLVKNYKALTSIPALASATIESEHSVKSVWTQRNIEKGKLIKFTRSILLSNYQKVAHSEPVDISSELLSQTSPKRYYKAVLRDYDGKQFLEIWQLESGNLLRSVDLAGLDLHGSIYTDGEFGTFEFSPDEKKLLYLAEKKGPKKEPFYKRTKPEDPKDKTSGDAAKSAPKGEEYLFEQDWGEQLVGKKKSVIVQFDIDKDTVQLLDGVPDNVCPAQVKYSPDQSGLVGVAYYTEPRKLGLIYCTNRPSTIFHVDFQGNYFELSLNNRSVKSPIFSPDGKTLLWLEREAGGPHMSCMALVKIDMPLRKDSKPETVVNIVPKKITTSNKREFFGIYNTGFPKRPWASNNRLLMNTNQKYTINSYVIDIDTGLITELQWDDGSQMVVDVNDADVVLALRRNFLVPDRLVLGRLNDDNTIHFIDISEKIQVTSLEKTTYEYLDFTADNGLIYNAVYLGPKNAPKKSVSLIVWPHGGPHSAFANYFMLEAVMFLSTGHAILLINYRGSIGSGDDSVYFLPGNVGTADVADCIHAVDSAVAKFPWINPNEMVLCGGSHGGFLVTHLSGQYPDKFKAVVARNPVIDIASMSVISDIPDWCYVEAGAPYTQEGEPDHVLLKKMRDASPIMHAHKVKAPTLLQIGSKDLRVPPHQGLEYYTRLKANGIDVRMNLYDDNHPLGTVPNELDNVINTILWIEKHLGREDD